eukprot:TRINITY_DN8604_c0_g1_i1.p1 TRINITY_DN8604_c0_g1~~TRINITY_DN8604_c0_g1_i1.p1  ORF type:complete len:708 (-),score=198.52 TRINITY_DN8604_c0_g1_i1:143-2266(-)
MPPKLVPARSIPTNSTGKKTQITPKSNPKKFTKRNSRMGNMDVNDDKRIPENPEINEEDQDDMYQNPYQRREREWTEEELNQKMPTKVLQPNNPNSPNNFTQFSFKDRVFKMDEMVDQMVIHFAYDGEFIYKESPEYDIQEAIKENREALIKEAKNAMTADDLSAHKEADTEEGLKKLKRTLRNKFNYNERQSQTVNEVIRERGVSTQPPPMKRLNLELNLWDVWDSYINEFNKVSTEGETSKAQVKEKPEKSDNSLYSVSFKRCLKIMERMVVQNEQQEQYWDYKYYFTEKDMPDISNSEGSLLPIWRITSEKQRKKHVTSICWNPRYSDFFAVGLGSYHFNRQAGQGYICCYSLKNTTYPEYFFTTPKGVMALDFHPKSPALLAVGLYDGTVMVFDIRSKHKKPIYQSTVRTMKHTEPVWQIFWNPDNSKNYSFYSISSDGRVTNWVLMKNKLEPEDIMKLKLVADTHGEDGGNLIGLACGLCFDFNKFEPNTFLVGTEEGKIHKCNLSYSGQYQYTFEGHIQAVYKVRWNYFHPRTFISASADWTVKIWDTKSPGPVMSFDLGTQVVDVSWAPYSSVVFAACTLEKVLVYDLEYDKVGKRGETKQPKQSKLTNIAFSPKDPVILVGDDHGGVTLFKLSPNLTPNLVKVPKSDEKKIGPDGKPIETKPDPKAPIEPPTPEQIAAEEEQKMEKILALVGKFDKDDL